jgi:transposase
LRFDEGSTRFPVFAIARKLSQLIYRVLRYGQDYVDIGEKAYEAQFEARRLASLKEAARGLGFTLVQEPLTDG